MSVRRHPQAESGSGDVGPDSPICGKRTAALTEQVRSEPKASDPNGVQGGAHGFS